MEKKFVFFLVPEINVLLHESITCRYDTLADYQSPILFNEMIIMGMVSGV